MAKKDKKAPGSPPEAETPTPTEPATGTEATNAEQHPDRQAVVDAAQNAEGKPPVRISKSIVRGQYKVRYGQRQGCGDEVHGELTAFTTEVGPNKRPVCSLDKLRQVAEANGLGAALASYAGLNIGQKRMNVGNRLRGMIRRGERVVIGVRVFNDPESESEAA